MNKHIHYITHGKTLYYIHKTEQQESYYKIMAATFMKFMIKRCNVATCNSIVAHTNNTNNKIRTMTKNVLINNNVIIVDKSVNNCSTINNNNIFANQIRSIKTKSSAKKRFLKRGNGSIKRWKQGRRHLNYNQRRKKLLKSLSSVPLKRQDKKVVRKLLNCKI